MHVLRLLGFGIVIGLLLVGIAARQEPYENRNWASQYRPRWDNRRHRPAMTHESKMARAKAWLQRHRTWNLFG